MTVAMSDQRTMFGALAVGSVFKLAALSWLRYTRRKSFVFVGKITALNLYPVKSCGSYPVDMAECSETGLRDDQVSDRHWVIVDENGSFVTQRKEPKMSLISSRREANSVALSAPGMRPVRLETSNTNKDSKRVTCRVWKDKVQVSDCGDEAASWICSYLGKSGFRIMRYIHGITSRIVEQNPIWESRVKQTDQVSFGDFCAYLLLSENSLSDLNSRLERKVTVQSFRPNIVVGGSTAFDEDNWMEVQIGEKTVLRNIALCPRCLMTTVDPEKGEKTLDSEPLKTLKTYRVTSQRTKDPMFGAYMGLEVEGHIKVGDPVRVLRFPTV